MIEVSAFRWVPPFAQGLVRDLRVRWALEEAGMDYKEMLIGPQDQASDAYRKLQPFGQVPAFREDDLTLFESGAIVLHIAERSERLMPFDAAAREHVRQWMFAALNSVEPAIMMLVIIDWKRDEPRPEKLRADVVARVKKRLDDVAAVLGDQPYLLGQFTAADLLMATVLRILRTTDLVAQVPSLAAYLQRCEARPAFQKALADQMAVFAANEPAKTG